MKGANEAKPDDAVIVNRQVPSLDPERQARARQYARLRRRLWATELVVGAAYLGLWVWLGWATAIDQALAAAHAGGLLPVPLPWWVHLLLVAAALGVPWFLLSLPLDYFAGFVLPHRYDLSTQSLAGWLSDLAKEMLLSAGLGGPLLLGLYLAIRLSPATWWIWAAGGEVLVMTALTVLSPVLLMPFFYKFKPIGEEHANLRERLLALAERAGQKVESVYAFDMSRRTRAANAALTGLGATRRVILGDTLLAEFTPDEIETVLAHELGHHAHRDIPLTLGVQGILSLGLFCLASVGLRLYAIRSALPSLADPTGLPILALSLGVLSMIGMPLGNAFSRWRESMADDFALRMTGKPEAFASAMTRLANQNLAEIDPERWVVLLLNSHPPLKSRIQKARNYASRA